MIHSRLSEEKTGSSSSSCSLYCTHEITFVFSFQDLNSIESGILEAREEEQQQQQPLSEDVILNAKAQGMLMTLKDLEEEPADASDVHIVNGKN